MKRLAILALAIGLPAQAYSVDLSVIDRTLLIEAEVVGQSTAPVIIAAGNDASAAIVDAVAKLGGSVVSRQDDIGYLLAELPLAAVQDFARRPDIVALQVAVEPVRGIASADDGPESVRPPKKGPAPGPWLTSDNPYTGETATQASSFKALHPDWNGRGVTLGFVEPADPTLPSMRGALDASGHVRPKYADFDMGPSSHPGAPVDLARSVSWQNTEVVRPTADGTVRIGEHVYRLPLNVVESQWRLCLRLPKAGAWDTQARAILWGVTTRQVWIASESAQDFAKAATGEVKSPYFIVRIGQRSAVTAQKASMAWVMKADEKSGKLGVMPTYARHPAMVASVMAGEGFMGSAIGHRKDGDRILFTRQMFQGKFAADVAFTGQPPFFATFQNGAYRGDQAEDGSAAAPVEIVAVEIPAGTIRVKPLEIFKEAKQAVDLTQAEIIVSVGRGIKEQKNIEMAQQLADALGGELAASRPICDSGWLPLDRQVGSSGQTVAPKLYLALGISGAIQHLVGMKGSRTIIAINKDAEAPIFEIADFGVVGDLFSIVPVLTEEIKKAKSGA